MTAASAALIVAIASAAFTCLQWLSGRKEANAAARSAEEAARASIAAEQSAAAAQESVAEVTKARFDADSPRVICTQQAIGWPPQSFDGPTSDPIEMLNGAKHLSTDARLVLPRHENTLVFVLATATMRNEGHSTAKVSFDRPVRISSEPDLDDQTNVPKEIVNDVLLLPDTDAYFEFTLGRTVGAWSTSPPPAELAYLEVTVHDPRPDGIVDKLWITTNISPLVQEDDAPPGTFKFNPQSQRDVGADGPHRQYRALGRPEFEMPWITKSTGTA
ncbi:MAG: hypothetical protein ACRD2C_18525 [Acidimicrobiales bacterium]